MEQKCGFDMILTFNRAEVQNKDFAKKSTYCKSVT
jgi:hypothetical protein